jgi:TetR/AcrR family transcriptional regulator
MASKRKDTSTEENIVSAAQKIFMTRGYDGARMQEIADEAGINKAMLHYYFENKDKLFEMVFATAYNTIAPDLSLLTNDSTPLINRIEHFINYYTDALMAQPQLASFVINELNRNPEKVMHFLKSLVTDNSHAQAFMRSVEKEGKANNVTTLHPIHLLMHIISLCYFPFVGKPLFQYLLKLDEFQFQIVLEQRKQETIKFIRLLLQGKVK